MSSTRSDITKLRKTVLAYYRKHGRHHLPWRTKKSAYRVLVSEIMLQQTQVDRVVPYYKSFLKKFPTVKALAQAQLADVLKAWQGLGYNRRAKMLHEAAKEILKNHNGRVPKAYEALITLPGIGGYTAKAVRVFAYDEPETLIETNVRSVFIHHFFPRTRSVSDKKLLPLIESSLGQCLDIDQVGEWYAALMDYGSYLKKEYPNPSRKSKHHTKQKAFKGSDREIRGAILRSVLKKEDPLQLTFSKERIREQIKALKSEGLI